MSELVDPYDGEQPVEPAPPVDVDDYGSLEADDDADPNDADPDGPDGAEPMMDDVTAMLRELAAVAAVDDLERGAEDEELAGLGAAAAVDRLTGTTTRVNAVLVDQLRLVGHWADLHGHVDDCPIAGVERLVTFGGDGTPEVAEFAAAELGVALHSSTHSAANLLADALDLRHRLPALWQSTLSGEVPVAKARRVAQDTRSLSVEAAAAVDRRIARIAGGLTWRRLSAIVRAAVLAADPQQASEAAEQAEAGAGVWVDDETAMTDGYGTLFARASAGDLAAFNHAVTVVAGALSLLGDTDGLQQRRSRALGILAHPQEALDLIERADRQRDQPAPPDGATGSPVADRQRKLDFRHVLYFHLSREAVQTMLSAGTGATGACVCGRSRADGVERGPGTGTGAADGHGTGSGRSSGAGAADGTGTGAAGRYGAGGFGEMAGAGIETLAGDYRDADVGQQNSGGQPNSGGQQNSGGQLNTVGRMNSGAQQTTVGRLEGVGPIIAEQMQRWLGHTSVVVKPVIDPDTMPAVDCWEVPERISEAVRLRRPADYFPWSTCTSRHQDNEHPEPYVPIDRGGPPGQTSVQTLAKITRLHHRVKTFGGWTVTPVKTDTWLWRSPTGHFSIVDPTGSTDLGRLT